MFETLTILGPGLLGASIARAVRERALARSIHIWAHRSGTRLAAEQADWCDSVFQTPENAVEGADLVIVATPVDTILDLLTRIAATVSAHAIITDVGSTKGLICRHGHAAFSGPGPAFVGSHPMAGSEKSGHAHARADLFENRVCILTPLEETPPAALDQVGRFWKALGMDLHTVSPETHDEIVAHISHLPHILAASLCSFLAGKPDLWKTLSGGGLRDSTRIAEGSPQIWEAILDQNRDEILRALSGFQEELHQLERALNNRQPLAVKALLERGARFRKTLRPGPDELT